MADRVSSTSGLGLAREVWSRRHWLAMGVLLAVLGVSLAVAFGVPPTYRATATVLVEREQVPEAMVRPSVTGEVETRLQTISQQILSRAKLAELIDRFGLYPDMRGPAAREAAVFQMRKDILLEPKVVDHSGGRTATVGFNLSYRGRDPETVAAVANALAALYVEQNTKTREQQASGTAQFLKAQVAEAKKKIEEQERRIGQAPAPVEAELAALERLNGRLRLNSERQLRAMDRRERGTRDIAVPGVPAGPGAPDSTALQIAKLKQELIELRTRFTDKYPDVVRVKAEIAALEARAASRPPAPPAEAPRTAPAAPARDVLAETDTELKSLKAEEDHLRQAIAVYERRMEDAPRRQQEYQREARDYATTKEFYQSLVKRYEDAQMAESMEQGQKGEQFRILDAAVPPKVPAAPNRMRLAIMALVVSLGAMVGAVTLSERLDTSFHTMDDLRSFTRIPVVAGIPPLATDHDANRRRRRLALGVLAFLLGSALAVTAAYLWAHDNLMLARMLAGGQ